MRFLSKKPRDDKPMISVVIIAYNMAREIPRTVQSFLPGYQQGVSVGEIEILVMENGSSHPVPPDVVASWPDNVRYIEVENPKSSPAHALNLGVELSRGDWVCPVIDGARMVTPGVFQAAKKMIDAHENPVITTIGYHLGEMTQQLNIANGYNQKTEDALLESIDWPNNPYDLFNISSLGASAQTAWLGAIAESNALIVRKVFYHEIGGYAEAFDTPGGGIVNHDFFKRCIEHPTSQYVLLLGEGSFHQYHGGVTTSRSVALPSVEDETKSTWDLYAAQYKRIRGEDYQVSETSPILYGEMTERVKAQALHAAQFLSTKQ